MARNGVEALVDGFEARALLREERVESPAQPLPIGRMSGNGKPLSLGLDLEGVQSLAKSRHLVEPRGLAPPLGWPEVEPAVSPFGHLVAEPCDLSGDVIDRLRIREIRHNPAQVVEVVRELPESRGIAPVRGGLVEPQGQMIENSGHLTVQAGVEALDEPGDLTLKGAQNLEEAGQIRGAVLGAEGSGYVLDHTLQSEQVGPARKAVEAISQGRDVGPERRQAGILSGIGAAPDTGSPTGRRRVERRQGIPSSGRWPRAERWQAAGCRRIVEIEAVETVLKRRQGLEDRGRRRLTGYG